MTFLNRLRLFREHGWVTITQQDYADLWERFGGSVVTHPQVVERLSGLAGIVPQYLGWPFGTGGELLAAIPVWGRYLALSKEALKQRGKKRLFDLGNAEIILPAAPFAPHSPDAPATIMLRHNARCISPLHEKQIATLRAQKQQLALCRAPEDLSGKFRYNLRREERLLEEAGGLFKPLSEISAAEQAEVYAALFERRWGFEAPGKAHLAHVFTLLREFMRGDLITLNGEPIAIQILYQAESPAWVSVEYINGGVKPEAQPFSPGSVLSFRNIQKAWADAREKGKTLRYSFGYADQGYKNRWCKTIPLFQV